MIGPGAQCYIPKFVEISSLVMYGRRVLRDFTIYGHGSHLCHVTNIIFNHFHFLVPKSLHTNLVKIVIVSEKSKF